MSDDENIDEVMYAFHQAKASKTPFIANIRIYVGKLLEDLKCFMFPL